MDRTVGTIDYLGETERKPREGRADALLANIADQYSDEVGRNLT